MSNEIFLSNITNILKETKKLTESNWIKIPSKFIENINFVITSTKCEVIKGSYMILKDVVTIYFENIDLIYSSSTIPLNMLEYYMNLLINQESKWSIVYIRNLMNHQLKINDTIIFENSKRGLVLIPKEEYMGLIHYKLIKNNGELGKKELNLYADKKYKIKGREFVDYKSILKL